MAWVERRVHYLHVIAGGAPSIVARIPFPTPTPWRRVVSALTSVLREHGARAKDLHPLEGLVPDPRTPEDQVRDEERRFAERLDGAFRGERDKLVDFWLYDWDGGRFVLYRAPVDGGTRNPADEEFRDLERRAEAGDHEARRDLVMARRAAGLIPDPRGRAELESVVRRLGLRRSEGHHEWLDEVGAQVYEATETQIDVLVNVVSSFFWADDWTNERHAAWVSETTLAVATLVGDRGLLVLHPDRSSFDEDMKRTGESWGGSWKDPSWPPELSNPGGREGADARERREAETAARRALAAATGSVVRTWSLYGDGEGSIQHAFDEAVPVRVLGAGKSVWRGRVLRSFWRVEVLEPDAVAEAESWLGRRAVFWVAGTTHDLDAPSRGTVPLRNGDDEALRDLERRVASGDPDAGHELHGHLVATGQAGEYYGRKMLESFKAGPMSRTLRRERGSRESVEVVTPVARLQALYQVVPREDVSLGRERRPVSIAGHPSNVFESLPRGWTDEEFVAAAARVFERRLLPRNRVEAVVIGTNRELGSRATRGFVRPDRVYEAVAKVYLGRSLDSRYVAVVGERRTPGPVAAVAVFRDGDFVFVGGKVVTSGPGVRAEILDPTLWSDRSEGHDRTRLTLDEARQVASGWQTGTA